MLSNVQADDSETMSFGSGKLLDDLFSYAKRNKIIFVGDPGQLPPVKENFSAALDMGWLQQQKRTAIAVTLSKIERIDKDNDILVLASMIRSMPANALPRYPKLPASNLANVNIMSSDETLFKSYVMRFKELGPYETIAIARSNKMVSDINRAMRRELYQELDKPLQENEILMVTHNNYSAELTNGDFVMVLEIGEALTHATLHFQQIKIRSLVSAAEHVMLISMDILYAEQQNFTKNQQKVLMIDFGRRMRRIGIKPNSDEYKARMMKDPYLNCLRAKYGYAVTCHKAQGGEWAHVYLFLEKGMYRMAPPELLRWWYTAVTRAKERLYLSDNWWIR